MFEITRGFSDFLFSPLFKYGLFLYLHRLTCKIIAPTLNMSYNVSIVLPNKKKHKSEIRETKGKKVER